MGSVHLSVYHTSVAETAEPMIKQSTLDSNPGTLFYVAPRRIVTVDTCALEIFLLTLLTYLTKMAKF